MSKQWTLEAGRTFCRNGVAHYALHRCGDDSKGHPTRPWEADAFAHELTTAVNAHAALVDALGDLLRDVRLDAKPFTAAGKQYIALGCVEVETLAKARAALALARGK